MNNNELKAPIKEFLDEIKSYIDGQLEYNKVIFRKKGGEFTAQLVLFVMLFGILAFVGLFLSFAFVYWYAQNGGTMTFGFLIVCIFYLFIALIIFAFRESLIFSKIRKLMAKNLASNDEKEFFKGAPFANDPAALEKYLEYLRKQNHKKEVQLEHQFNKLGESFNMVNLTRNLVKSGLHAIMTTSNMVKAAYQLTKRVKTKNRKKLKQ